MATKDEIIAAIQAEADATGDGNMRISMGAPGSHVENSIGQRKPTGAAWEPSPKTWEIVCSGFAAWADSIGVGSHDVFRSVRQLTASGPVTAGDWVVELAGAAVAASLPPASSVPGGKQIIVKEVNGSPGSSVVPSGADTIDGAAAPLLLGALGAARLYSDGSSDWRTW